MPCGFAGCRLGGLFCMREPLPTESVGALFVCAGVRSVGGNPQSCPPKLQQLTH